MLTYITESEVGELIVNESRRASEQQKNHVVNSVGFSKHLISVGNSGFQIAERICRRHPSLSSQIDPNVELIAGYMHDIGKIWIGSPYHEIQAGYEVIKNGEKNGLVRDGTSEQRKAFLRRVADCLSADVALAEELGSDFPNTALYPAFVTTELINQVNFLRTELGDYFTTPDTFERAIAMYADMTDLNGESISITERLEEIVERYHKYAKEAETGFEKDYWKKRGILSGPNSNVGQRIQSICGLVDRLLDK